MPIDQTTCREIRDEIIDVSSNDGGSPPTQSGNTRSTQASLTVAPVSPEARGRTEAADPRIEDASLQCAESELDKGSEGIDEMPTGSDDQSRAARRGMPNIPTEDQLWDLCQRTADDIGKPDWATMLFDIHWCPRQVLYAFQQCLAHPDFPSN